MKSLCRALVGVLFLLNGLAEAAVQSLYLPSGQEVVVGPGSRRGGSGASAPTTIWGRHRGRIRTGSSSATAPWKPRGGESGSTATRTAEPVASGW